MTTLAQYHLEEAETELFGCFLFLAYQMAGCGQNQLQLLLLLYSSDSGGAEFNISTKSSSPFDV
jgi:hypothetical protein